MGGKIISEPGLDIRLVLSKSVCIESREEESVLAVLILVEIMEQNLKVHLGL